jgi:endogenous inhibitor of DNA gyrase (YacG/DUF329 family)
MSAPPPDSKKVCAICGRPQDARFKPFCSKRCADVDLGRWLKGGYAIPAGPADEGETPGKLPDSGEE